MTGGMTEWNSISCQRGCETHHTLTVHVDLSKPHTYRDLTPIPERFHDVNFDMVVFDPDRHPVDSDIRWCPAHDAVSETIIATGIWEPVETVLALHVLSSDEPGVMVDAGCQIGWFSALAATQGRQTIAIDADPLPLGLLSSTIAANGWRTEFGPQIVGWRHRFGAVPYPDSSPGQTRLAKIDVEGAEAAVLIWLGQYGLSRIDHMLIEMSPCFNDSYHSLARWLHDAGFVPYRLPDKQTPPVVLDDVPAVMEGYRMGRDEMLARLDAISQENFWWRREDATW